MNEVTLQWVQLIKLVIIAISAMLYGFGGVSGKWKRRFIAPCVIVAGMALVSSLTSSFSWWYVAVLPFLIASYTIGYGSSIFIEKVIKRARYGLACGCSFLPVFWVNQAWTLLFLHIGVCVFVSVVAGVWNQTSSARSEETLIGASTVLIPIFTI